MEKGYLSLSLSIDDAPLRCRSRTRRGVCPEDHYGLGDGHVYVRAYLGEYLAGGHVCEVIEVVADE